MSTGRVTDVYSLPIYHTDKFLVYLSNGYVQFLLMVSSVVQKSFGELEEKFQTCPDSFSSEQPFLTSLLKNSDLSKQDKILLMTEIFMGGIDAVSRGGDGMGGFY